jgi:NADPH-dependent 2,4-dienoyl-CoA reductase/sulfur reductase-like enzyme/rhodanese-related sulfurtransferase
MTESTTRIVIVGGVAGGASAAARARRLSESAEIILFERGDYVSFANCGLPYHISGAIPDRRRLMVQTPESLNRRFRIDVRINSEVTAIDRARKSVTVHNLSTGTEYQEHYDTLILSPGAEPVRPNIPGADDSRVLTLRTIPDMDAVMQAAQETPEGTALVIGAGYIGLESAEALRERGLGVILVELQPQVMATADPEMTAGLAWQLRRHGVDLRLNTSVNGFERVDGQLRALLSTGETADIDFVVMSVGVRPETSLARAAGLEIGGSGGIAVDDRMRTSDPDIYAVGDAVEVKDFVTGDDMLVPLAGPANRQGRIAADNALGRDSAYRATQGTAICKVFETTIGMTGLNEKALARRGMAYEKVYVHPASHATYYPGAAPISMKLLFSSDDGRVLGAQAVGNDGVDKRIDVLATAIRAGMTVYDLEHLELAYAPPYGSAKDPVNYAGFVAVNVLRGDVKLCHFEDVATPREDRFILDVRTMGETRRGTVPGAYVIPVDELRDRLDELPRDKELLVICQVGMRGYIACRILSQNDFRCRNLSGGFTTYTAFGGEVAAPGAGGTS